MKTYSIVLITAFSFLVMSCNHEKKEETATSANQIIKVENEVVDIQFQIAKNYFVKNTIDSIANPLIETQATFDSIFGMATVMGEEGKPTAIDFSKQSVIGVMFPETEYITNIVPVKLSKNNEGKLIFSYAIDQGKQTTSTMVASCLLIINKEAVGEVILNEVAIER